MRMEGDGASAVVEAGSEGSTDTVGAGKVTTVAGQRGKSDRGDQGGAHNGNGQAMGALEVADNLLA